MSYPRALDWIPAVALMATISWLSHQPDWPSPARGYPDWLLHGLAFGLLAVLDYWATSDRLRRRGARPWIMALALAVGFGVLDELHQSTVPGRDASLHDVLADGLGALVALIVVRVAPARAPFARP